MVSFMVVSGGMKLRELQFCTSSRCRYSPLTLGKQSKFSTHAPSLVDSCSSFWLICAAFCCICLFNQCIIFSLPVFSLIRLDTWSSSSLSSSPFLHIDCWSNCFIISFIEASFLDSCVILSDNLTLTSTAAASILAPSFVVAAFMVKFLGCLGG